MKRTKREENSIIITTVLYGLLIIVMVYLFLSYVIPGLKDVGSLKSALSGTYTNLQRVEKEGVNLTEFNNSVKGLLSKDSKDKNKNKDEELYSSVVLKSIDEAFYNKNIKNTTEANFNLFIDKVTKKYASNSTLNSGVDTIGKILPVYSEDVSDLGNNGLTDFKFINYIESVAETFNIKFNDSIGISDLKLLDSYAVGIGNNSLDTNIFYIPLDLNITGTKSSIIDFLYFIENVGKIELLDDSSIYVGNEISSDFQNFKSLVLKGQLKKENYNIFNNQFFDIENISFQEYIDSSFDPVEDKGTFVNYIKSNQGRESIKANVKLRFYVKGIPIFKIENFIKDFITDFGKTKTTLDTLLSKAEDGSIKQQKLQEISTVVNQIQLTIVSPMQKKLSSKLNIDETYKQANIYKKILDGYKKDLEQYTTVAVETATGAVQNKKDLEKNK
ncbi:MAG: hypothetical protein PHH98_05390 [Candidatus Gracilibacteria bacterium]|nr:hypothetical protein [Candidatus Gracilibacteria bacterium]